MAERGQPVAIPAPVAELVAAWEARSANRFVAIMATDVHVAVPPLHVDLNGRDDVWLGVAQVFAAFGALRYTVRHRYLSPDGVTDEVLLEGLQSQEFLGAPPPGRPGSVAARVMVRHDGQVVTHLTLWPDVAALRELSDGVARRIDLRTAGPAAPVVAALRATIPAPEGKVSVGQQRQQGGATLAEWTPALLPGAPTAAGAGLAGGGASGAHPSGHDQGRGRGRSDGPKAPLPRKVRRRRAFAAGIVMLAVAALLVTFVVQGVKRTKDAVASPRTRPSSAGHAPRSGGPSRTPTPAPSPPTPPPVTFNKATNSYSFSASLLFALNSATLRPDARTVLKAVVRRVESEKRYGTLYVTGYTDDTGTVAGNLVLSRARARAVGAYLNGHLDGSRFSVVPIGKGQADPKYPNDTPGHQQLNRRVEIKVPKPTS